MMMANKISPACKDSIASDLQRGCTQQSMIESMVQAKFDAALAANCIACVANDAKT